MRILAGLLFLVTACTASPESVTPQPVETDAQALHPELAGLPGMVSYRDVAGDIAVISPAGDVARNLTEDASSDVVYQQPTWGPEGVLAWTAIDRPGGTSTVRIAGVEAGEVAAVGVAVAPFYLYWSPDGQTLAALGSGEATLELWLIDLDEEPAAATAEGSPFYFSWLARLESNQERHPNYPSTPLTFTTGLNT